MNKNMAKNILSMIHKECDSHAICKNCAFHDEQNAENPCGILDVMNRYDDEDDSADIAVSDDAVVCNNPTHDEIHHPVHYCTANFECINVMLETQGIEAVKSFCLCNAFKYLYRHNGKNGDEDVRKAFWYINKYLELSDED